MSQLIACMGGWCTKREACANYHAEDRRYPAERLCLNGEDGTPKDQRIVIKTDDRRDSEVPA